MGLADYSMPYTPDFEAMDGGSVNQAPLATSGAPLATPGYAAPIAPLDDLIASKIYNYGAGHRNAQLDATKRNFANAAAKPAQEAAAQAQHDQLNQWQAGMFTGPPSALAGGPPPGAPNMQGPPAPSAPSAAARPGVPPRPGIERAFPGSSSSSSSGSTPKGWKGALAAGQEAEIEGTRHLAADEIEAANRRAQGYRDQQERAQVQEDVRARHEADRQYRAEQAGKEVQRLADEARNTQIDPKRAFKNMDAGVGAMAVLFSGLMGSTSKPNIIMEELDKKQDKDIQAQRDNQMNAWRGVDAQRGIYHDMMARFGDQRSAEAATKLFQNEQFARQLQQFAAESDSKTVKDKADILIGQLGQKNALLQQQIEAAAARGTGFDAKAQAGRDERYVPELGGFARSPEEGRELRKRTEQGRLIINGLNDMEAYAKKNHNWVDRGANKFGYTTQAQEDLERMADGLVQPIVAYRGGGAAAEGEGKRAREEILGQLRIGRPVHEVIASTRARFEKDLSEMPRAYGIQSAQEGYASDPRTGRTIPVSAYAGSTAAPRPSMPGSFKATK